jgi:transglutaminase-like putative cysteine protease
VSLANTYVALCRCAGIKARIARKKHTFFAASEILKKQALERTANIVIKKSE